MDTADWNNRGRVREVKSFEVPARKPHNFAGTVPMLGEYGVDLEVP